MKADTVDLAAIFGQPVRYVVPIFQRPYVWKKETEWEPLWQDIQAVLERQLDDTPLNDAIPHFLGAVVLDQLLTPTGMVQARFIIDGQQRLTSLQLFIAAARSIAVDAGHVGPAQILGKLLFNDEFLIKDPSERFKVVPTAFDQPAFAQAVGGSTDRPVAKHRILEAYQFFQDSVGEWVHDPKARSTPERRLEVLSTVLWKLLIVVAIDLDGKDNAQVIFETLNARGTPLLAADLIKNLLFQAAISRGLNIEKVYSDYWKPLDADWWRAEVQTGRLKRPRLDIFMNHWLAMELGREVVSNQLFAEFKRFLAASPDRVTSILADISRYAAVYETFEHQADSTPLGVFLYRLNTLEVTTAYPILLWMFGPDGVRDETERLRALRVIEDWLIRRVVVKADTKGYSDVFLALLNRLRGSQAPSAVDVAGYLRGLSGERGYWPVDDQVRTALISQPLYATLTRSRLRLILEGIEDHMRTTGMAEDAHVTRGLTIEHVLPQDWRQHWPLPWDDNGLLAVVERDSIKQTIGNLTLVTAKLNPSMSNGPWRTKQEALRKYSVLMLASDIRDADVWNELAIAHRSARLADVFLATWPGPQS